MVNDEQIGPGFLARHQKPTRINCNRSRQSFFILVPIYRQEYYNIENQPLVSHGTFASLLLLLSSQLWAAPKSTRFEARKVDLQATIFSSLHKFLIWMLRHLNIVRQ